MFNRGINALLVLLRRNEFGFVLDASAPALQLFDQQLLGHVLRHHCNERIRAFGWLEFHVRERAVVSHNRHSRYAIRLFKEGGDDSGHVENFKRAGKIASAFECSD